MTPFALALVLLSALAAFFATATFLRVTKDRRRARRRVVEKPNSHYTSPLVRDTETRHRWHDIALDRVHEINRQEVLRLLAKVEASSVEALRPNERVFLDHMADVAGTEPPQERQERTRPLTPDLRHRPA